MQAIGSSSILPEQSMTSPRNFNASLRLAKSRTKMFIQDKTRGGAPFRFGTLQIPEEDFCLIASKMVNDQNLLAK